MAADLRQAENLLKEVEALISKVNNAREEELINASECMELQQVRDGIKAKIAEANEEERTLKIGIIGDVKAGKSSFINTCIFGGNSILPTSVTPTTATLTKITYSETPRTTIHFCTREDWTRIEDGANSYDISLQKAYDRYVKIMNEKNNGRSDVFGAISNFTDQMMKETIPFYSGKNNPHKETNPRQITIKTKQEFAASWKGCSEIEKACKEIVDMVKKCTSVDLLSLLGTTAEIAAEDLNDYVGANGTYTPIVNYVEMQTDNEMLDGLMIVDTPGLEDPVESRGRKTKEFLEICDVVILLSRCSQFMGESTVRMIDQLPSAGVRRIIIAGSKFDLGVLDDNHPRFEDAVKSTALANNKQFRNNIAALINQYSDDVIRLKALKQIEQSEPILTSSVMYTISQKIKNGSALNENEQHVMQQLHGRYQGFNADPKLLMSLSGIKNIQKKLNEVIAEKEKIISESGDALVQTVSLKLRMLLSDIITDSKRRMNDLKNAHADEYKQKYERLVYLVDSTRKRLRHIFEIAADDCQKNELIIESYLKMDISNNTKLKVVTKTDTKNYTSGHLWWKKDHTETTTTQSVSVADVINNINAYYASCQGIVSEEFKTLVDKETVSAKVKEIVLEAFNNGRFDFSEDDILLPLESTLSKIEIPPYVVDSHRFIDRARSKFSAGYAKDDEIHKLNAMQSELLSEASDEMIKALRDCTESIRKTLLTQAACFSDDIENRISGESESVLKQMQTREEYIKKYEELIAELTKAKAISDKAVV